MVCVYTPISFRLKFISTVKICWKKKSVRVLAISEKTGLGFTFRVMFLFLSAASVQFGRFCPFSNFPTAASKCCNSELLVMGPGCAVQPSSLHVLRPHRISPLSHCEQGSGSCNSSFVLGLNCKELSSEYCRHILCEEGVVLFSGSRFESNSHAGSASATASSARTEQAVTAGVAQSYSAETTG